MMATKADETIVPINDPIILVTSDGTNQQTLSDDPPTTTQNNVKNNSKNALQDVQEEFKAQQSDSSTAQDLQKDSQEQQNDNIRAEDVQEQSQEQRKTSRLFYLRIIKRISLVFIALCICSGVVFSKISLVSITGRMFEIMSTSNVTTFSDERIVLSRSLLFIPQWLFVRQPDVT